MQSQQFELHRASAPDRLPLARMLELYQHDLSDIWDQDLNLHGEYGYALAKYFQHPACSAWLILVGSNYEKKFSRGKFVEYQLDDARWHGYLQCFDNTASH